MKKKLYVMIDEEGKIQLPQELMKQLFIKEKEQVLLEYETKRASQLCFHIDENSEEEMFEEGFFCVPKRMLERAGLNEENLHIIMNEDEITITSTIHIISALPTECLNALVEQDVDMEQLAIDIVERINDHEF